jgi:hypothetical protein
MIGISGHPLKGPLSLENSDGTMGFYAAEFKNSSIASLDRDPYLGIRTMLDLPDSTIPMVR